MDIEKRFTYSTNLKEEDHERLIMFLDDTWEKFGLGNIHLPKRQF